MLKKLIISTILIIGLSSFADSISNQITKLEEVTLGIDYPTEKIENRLSRLEKNIYGKEKTGSVQIRLKNLNKDIAGDVIGQEIKPSKDTFMSEEDFVKSDGSEKYPIIDEIEETLFSHSTPEKSLQSRLKNIEKKMFNKTFETEDYYTRMERIKAEHFVKQPQIAEQKEQDIQSFYDSPQRSRWDQQKGTFSSYNSTDEYELTVLEQKILKNTYPNESFAQRLSRLENKVFETDFFYDDDKIRLDRLSSATKFKKSVKKYNAGNMSSKINTVVSIGTMVLMILAFIL